MAYVMNRNLLCVAVFTFLSVVCFLVTAPFATANVKPPEPNTASFFSPMRWTQLASGLKMGEATHTISPGMPASSFVILQISPTHYAFSLRMLSETGTPLPLRQWAKKFNLSAAINASMYLQDNSTSTGYMRNEKHTNNKKVGKNLGAFFVAEPHNPTLPQADIIELATPNYKETLQQYAIVVQNYRFTDNNANLLWKNSGTHSMAIIGKTSDNKIIFAICTKPLTPQAFYNALMSFVPTLTSSIYVEGGMHAQMAVAIPQVQENHTTAEEHTTDIIQLFTGQHTLFPTQQNESIPMPNVIGISPR